MEEVWKPIKGYEGLYEVSTYGRIRSLDRIIKRGKVNVSRRGQILKPVIRRLGYSFVTLCKDKKDNVAIHRLVAQAFIPNPDEKPFVNHIDFDPTNINVKNLEWCTQSENMQHSLKAGRLAQGPDSIERSARAKWKPVEAKNIATGEVRLYGCIKDSVKDGFCSANVSACCYGRRKTHKGYTWKHKYMEEQNG